MSRDECAAASVDEEVRALLGPDTFSPRAVNPDGKEYAYDLRPARKKLRELLVAAEHPAAQRCRARVQTEWGLRCARKATKVWKGIKLCSQHEQVARRGNLNIDQDVVRDGE